VLALVLVAAGATLWWRQRSEPGAQAPRQAVAIFGFQSTTGRSEVAWLSTALAEMLGTELARGEGLRTVPGENVARARQELALAPSDSLSAESLRKLRILIGCDFVVMGSYVAVAAGEGLQIRLDLRLQDAALGETVEATAHSGSEAQLFDLVAAAGSELREHLGSAVSSDDGAPSLPRNARAARLYAEALESLRRGEPQTARDQLVEAVGLEPANALLHSALASAWRALGHAERSAEHARRAFELSNELGREDRLAIEARYRESVGEWPAAITAWRSLWALYPDNLEYGLKLAAAATAAHLPEEALQTVEKLRRLPAPASLDPRIDLAEAAAAGFV
jgi:tetratricopeptide (TPR) repeat protein